MWPVILWRRKFGDVKVELDLDIISRDKAGGGVILSGGEAKAKANSRDVSPSWRDQ